MRARLAAEGHAEVRSRYDESIIIDQMETYFRDSVAR
jgi:hypothetical protein